MSKPAMTELLSVGGCSGFLGVVINEVLQLGCTLESSGEHQLC